MKRICSGSRASRALLLSLAIGALLVVVSAAVLITVKVLVRLPGRARGADNAFIGASVGPGG